MIPLTGFLLLSLAVALTAAVCDVRTGHIPNWLTFGALALAPVLHIALGAAVFGLRGAGSGAITVLTGVLLCSVVPLILYRLAGMGGGDLKLLAALGALLGPVIGLETQLHAFVVVLLYASVRLAYEGKLLRTLGRSLSLLIYPFRAKERRPEAAPELMTSLRFGPSVALGVFTTTLAHLSLP